jgi:hypothetical protein
MSEVVPNKEIKEDKKKRDHPYVVSKRTPSSLETKVKSIISEVHDKVFVACGNTI